ncbi:hypothetical protein ABKN59_009701 [Abortiporus biennis]
MNQSETQRDSGSGKEVVDTKSGGQVDHIRVEEPIAIEQQNAQGFTPDNSDRKEGQHPQNNEAWSKVSRILKQYDEDRVQRVKDDMDTLLVFWSRHSV